jgi:chemosensory pili system protein ChpA (sensor histidine kinase/response regulator)
VSGVDTLIDSNVLTDMVDPLMHLLRNAVDHGIEYPEVRRTQGKNPIGRITLKFGREGNNVVIRCQDDGVGLDMKAIRRTAEQRALVDPGAMLSEVELSQLILLPGFSTRTEVTQTSGRGVGMDAVYSRLQELKGSIQIRSETGKGCLIELRLPFTLISTHALLVRAKQSMFAISERGVTQILYSGSGKVSRLGKVMTYQVGNDIFEASYLESLLNLPLESQVGDSLRPVILVREEMGAMRAILVEEILDSRDLVVKNMGDYIPKLKGIVGATILGDGSVAPVLDLPELLRVAPTRTFITPVISRSEAVGNIAVEQHRRALVVDDSLSARRSLAQFMEDAGFEVHTARDGLEAIGIIHAKRPDILLVDLEMPRMNGLELTSHVRANDVTNDLPVIMITSRSTEKHRQEANRVGVNVYLTKPFAEDELLEHVNAILECA